MGDFCACNDCRTVHSASAYVADALHYLKERQVEDTAPAPGQPSTRCAKDVLFERRPDLGEMDLSCANTNTEIPYIDVVCELLEDRVSPDPGIPFTGALTPGTIPSPLLTVLTDAGLGFTDKAKIYGPRPRDSVRHALFVRDSEAVARLSPVSGRANAWNVFLLKQTYGPQDEVMAMPQYLNQAAYAKLETANYAFSSPFGLSHEECRAYFRQFNVPRGRQNTAEGDVVTGGIAEVVIDVRHLQVLLCSYRFFIASLIVFHTAISLNLRSVHSSLHPRLVKLPQHQPFGPLDKLDMHPRRPSPELVIFADMTQTLSRRLV
jgi:hypothetical protein